MRRRYESISASRQRMSCFLISVFNGRKLGNAHNIIAERSAICLQESGMFEANNMPESYRISP